MQNIGTRVYLRPDQVESLRIVAENTGNAATVIVRQAIDSHLQWLLQHLPEQLAQLTPRRDGPHEPQ